MYINAIERVTLNHLKSLKTMFPYDMVTMVQFMWILVFLAVSGKILNTFADIVLNINSYGYINCYIKFRQQKISICINN